jgi:hypothetical protein
LAPPNFLVFNRIVFTTIMQTLCNLISTVGEVIQKWFTLPEVQWLTSNCTAFAFFICIYVSNNPQNFKSLAQFFPEPFTLEKTSKKRLLGL